MSAVTRLVKAMDEGGLRPVPHRTASGTTGHYLAVCPLCWSVDEEPTRRPLFLRDLDGAPDLMCLNDNCSSNQWAGPSPWRGLAGHLSRDVLRATLVTRRRVAT